MLNVSSLSRNKALGGFACYWAEGIYQQRPRLGDMGKGAVVFPGALEGGVGSYTFFI